MTSRLGTYELIREIGRGATGAVYEARDLRTGEEVALKILWDFLASQKNAVDRFRRESELLMALADPHVIAARGPLQQFEGRYFFATELVRGKSLADLLRVRRSLPPPLALDLAIQLLGGLSAAHRQGIIHRDLKPSNLLLEKDGSDVRLRIGDFGLAEAADLMQLTITGQVMGTVPYMSPERCMGRMGTIASDLYSVGVILYEMLEGKLPFTGQTPVEIFRAHLEEEPPPLSSGGNPAGEALQREISKALFKDPRQRHADAQEMITSLEAVARSLGGGKDWGEMWKGETTGGVPPVFTSPGKDAPLTEKSLGGDPGLEEDDSDVLCHLCGALAPSDVQWCPSCQARLALSLFPGRCLPWPVVDRILWIVLLLFGALSLFVKRGDSAILLASVVCVAGIVFLYVRDLCGSPFSRRLWRSLLDYLHDVGYLGPAWAFVMLGLLVKSLSWLWAGLEQAPWLLSPVWGGLWLLHFGGVAGRRDRATLDEWSRLETGWKVEEHRQWPCSLSDLKQKVSNGAIVAQTLVCGPGTGWQWVRAARVPALSAAFGRCHRCAGELPANVTTCVHCGAPLYYAESAGLGLSGTLMRLSLVITWKWLFLFLLAAASIASILLISIETVSTLLVVQGRK